MSSSSPFRRGSLARGLLLGLVSGGLCYTFGPPFPLVASVLTPSLRPLLGWIEALVPPLVFGLVILLPLARNDLHERPLRVAGIMAVAFLSWGTAQGIFYLMLSFAPGWPKLEESFRTMFTGAFVGGVAGAVVLATLAPLALQREAKKAFWFFMLLSGALGSAFLSFQPKIANFGLLPGYLVWNIGIATVMEMRLRT